MSGLQSSVQKRTHNVATSGESAEITQKYYTEF